MKYTHQEMQWAYRLMNWLASDGSNENKAHGQVLAFNIALTLRAVRERHNVAEFERAKAKGAAA